MRKIVSDLWKRQLYNAARTHAGQPPGRKVSYIQITHDDLQRLDLFKPSQFLRIPHNQLPLLRPKPPGTSLPTSLSNTHTYTPYAERYCLLCLPLQNPGDETHSLLYCSHFSPLIQPAIHSLMLNLRQFDLWAWATYTYTQKVAMLLGSIPPKLDRQHEKAWLLKLLIFPTCTQLIYSLQSHFRLIQPSVSPVSCPLATSSFSPPSDDIPCQVCQSPFDEHQMLLCDIRNAAWHLSSFSLPLPLSHMDSGNTPYAPRSTSYPSQQHSTFAFLPPSLISTLIRILQKIMTRYH